MYQELTEMNAKLDKISSKLDNIHKIKLGDDSNLDKQKIHSIIKALINHAEKSECQHEDTYRGGSIWTICNDCGRKWADDRGGFKPYQQPKALEDAYDLLDQLK